MALDRERLCRLTTQSFAYAGRLSFELRDDEAATSLFTAALRAADEVRDEQTKAAVLTSWSMVTLHSKRGIAEAEGRAGQAVRAALRGSSEPVRARAFAVEAEVHAGNGDGRRAMNALRCAERHLARTPPGEELAAFDDGRLEGFKGVCALRLGRWEEAGRHLESAMGSVRPLDVVQRSIVFADRALAQLQAGELEAGRQFVDRAIDLAAQTRGRVTGQRLLHLRQVLGRWTGEPSVRDLDTRLVSALLG